MQVHSWYGMAQDRIEQGQAPLASVVSAISDIESCHRCAALTAAQRSTESPDEIPVQELELKLSSERAPKLHLRANRPWLRTLATIDDRASIRREAPSTPPPLVA